MISPDLALTNTPLEACVTSSSATAESVERLQNLLIARAERDGLLDITYRFIDTPVGSLLLAATDNGLVRVAFNIEDHDQVLNTIAEKLSPRILRSTKRLETPAREIDEYFQGLRHSFDLRLDLSLSKGFRRQVQQQLAQIPYGSTETYRDVARSVGNPGAARAVGSACATNPLPIVLPCHRVLRSDGSWGGYVGGIEAKAALLQLESAAGRNTLGRLQSPVGS